MVLSLGHLCIRLRKSTFDALKAIWTIFSLGLRLGISVFSLTTLSFIFSGRTTFLYILSSLDLGTCNDGIGLLILISDLRLYAY